MIGGTTGFVKPMFCEQCNRVTRHESDFLVGLVLFSMFSCGLLFPLFLLMYFKAPHWLCQTCGSKRKKE